LNYVAHLFLAEPTDEHRIGNLLADFTNGTLATLRARYGDAIARGIKHHRGIDRFTDEHPRVRHSVDTLRADFGIYGPIVVDVIYDHFLLRHWDLFTDQSEDQFFDEVYRSLARTDWDYPNRYRVAVDRMLARRWLETYHLLENVAYALMRVGQRFSQPTPLADALPGMQAHYRNLEADFLAFFPELIEYARSVDCELR
jgi:acyl carrier protein phosphodiesterase